MPGSKSPGPSIQNPATYEALKRKGLSKESAAAISNAALNQGYAKGKHRKSKDDDEEEMGDGASIEWLTRDKEFSSERRKELAKAGKAMPHGGYPIENEPDLKRAIRAFGRAKNKAATKAWIKKRARALGKTELLPENWDVKPDWATLSHYDEWRAIDDTRPCPTCGSDGVLANGDICPTCEGHGNIAPAEPYVKGVGPAGTVRTRAIAAPAPQQAVEEPDDPDRQVLQAIARHVRFGNKIKQMLGASLEQDSAVDLAVDETDARKKPPPDDDDDDDDDAEDSAQQQDSVELHDSVQLVVDQGSIRKSADGYLVASARIARTGVQLYDGKEVGRPDLGTVRVYRPEHEVFSKKTMQSLAHKPITLEHPPQMVNANNWDQYAIGHIGDEVTRDGDTVRVPMVIMDGRAIRAYERDGVRQLSVGYSTELKWGQGVTPEGEPYDAMQTAIRGNHLAVVPAARGGSQLRIGDEQQHLDHQKGDSPMVKMLIDGQGIEFDNELAANHVLSHIASLQKQVEDARKKKDQKTEADPDEAEEEQEEEKKTRGAKDAEFAALKGENVALKKQLEDALASKADAKLIDAQVKEKIDLLLKADAVMEGKGDFEGKSADEIRRTVVTAKIGDAAKDLSDAELVGAFKILTAGVKPRTGADRLADSLSMLGQQNGIMQNSPQAVRAAAYEGYVNNLKDAWKTRPTA